MLVEFVAGRGPVFAAVGAESTRPSWPRRPGVTRSWPFRLSPADGRLTELQTGDHFRALADAVGVPVIVQDASGYVGQSIPLGVYVRPLEQYGEDIILFKPEASPIPSGERLVRNGG